MRKRLAPSGVHVTRREDFEVAELRVNRRFTKLKEDIVDESRRQYQAHDADPDRSQRQQRARTLADEIANGNRKQHGPSRKNYRRAALTRAITKCVPARPVQRKIRRAPCHTPRGYRSTPKDSRR